MSWNKLAPIAKTTGRPMASASIVVNKDGVPKISLILSASLKDEFGDPAKADISAGEGEHLGSLLIEFTPKGAFEVKRFVSGGARVFVPVPEGIPDKPVANAPCTLGEKVRHAENARLPADAPPESVVIKLPVEAWAADLSGRAAPRPPSGGSAVQPPPQAVGNGRQVDMVEYLSSKGVKISRLAENRFSVAGETLQFSAVLKMVNDKRKAADLDPLSAMQVR